MSDAHFIVDCHGAYWSKTSDEYDDIIDEFKLNPADCVRVSLWSDIGDVRQPLDKWRYQLDAYVTPAWYNAVEVESRVRSMLPDWWASRVFTSGDHVIEQGRVYAAGTATLTLKGRAQAIAMDTAIVWLFDHSEAWMWENSVARLWDDANVILHGESKAMLLYNSKGVAFDTAKVQLAGKSKVQLYDTSEAQAWDNTTVTLHDESVGRLWGNSKGTLWDDAYVELSGNATATGADNSTIVDDRKK